MSRRMKDSGIEWLGEIPAHWKVKRLKHVATINDEVLSETTDPNFRFQYIDIGSVDSNGEIANCITLDFESSPSRARRKLRESDVLVSTVRTYLRAIASVSTEHGNSIASTGFAVVRPRSVDNRFAGYSLRSDYFVSNVVAMSVGVSYPAINANDLGFIAVSIPPFPEQRAIADFLDAETQRIDTLIDNQRRLVDLLRERRQAIITQAVTKGLDHGVAMRDSGIEWLGEIPAHWEVKRLKHVGTAKIGLTYSPANIVGENDGMIVLRASNIQNGAIVYEDNVFVNSKIPSQLILHKGDVLICSRSGSRGLIGKNAMIDFDSEGVTFGAFMTAFRSRYNDYIYRVFNSALFQYHLGAFGTSTVNQITLDILLDLKIPFPPLPEQRAIADHLDTETERIDTLVSKLQCQIELLTERRQAVITAAVTGKLEIGT